LSETHPIPFLRSRDQLDAIALTREGTLRDTPYPLLLLALARKERSALLTLSRNQLSKEIVFEAGAPVECHSNIATESLGRFMVSIGKLSEEDYRSAISAAAAKSLPLEEILTERQLIAPSDLYRVLQQNLGRKLLEPFSWKSGTWHLSFDVPAIESSLRVRVPQLVVTGIMKVEPQEGVDAAIASLGDNEIGVSSEPYCSVEELRLNPEQQRVFDAAKHGVSIASLREGAGSSVDDLNRTVYAFTIMGLVTGERALWRREPSVMASIPDIPLEPAIESTPAAPVAAATSSVSPEDVMAAYLSHRRKDALDLLGLEESAGALEITRAWIDYADRFLPTRFDKRAPDGLRDKAQELFVAGTKAYAELADPMKREDLLSRRRKKREFAAEDAAVAESTAVRAKKRAVIDPEELCKQGQGLVEAGRLREALSYFEMAAECDAQNGTYASEVAFCRFQLLISPAAVALKSLKNAMRIDPRCGVAYLYAGKVLLTMGSKLEAESYIRRAASMMPRDKRPAEALRAF
jgi:tetratricopeptide (TPR) repeat protein